MLKKIFALTTFLLITVIFAGCVDTFNSLPAPYNDLYVIQKDTSQELLSASQKMQNSISNPATLATQATELEGFIRDQRNKIINIAVADAESIKLDTIDRLDAVKQLASSIKANALKLQENPGSESETKLISGYISRLKTESTKIEDLQEQLKQVASPEQQTQE